MSNTSFDNNGTKIYNLKFFSLKKLSKNFKLKNKTLANDYSFNNIDDDENEDSELSSFEDIDNCLNINFDHNKEKNISFKTFKNNNT